MTGVFNLLDGDVPESFDRPGYAHRRARVLGDLGGELLGGTLYETPPGEKLWPYHWELGCEEWLVVVAGRPTLRAPDGEWDLQPGDIVHFEQGLPGAHQLLNESKEPFRVLICSTRPDVSVAGYPDSGKLYVSAPRFDVDRVVPDRMLDYWEGEG